MHPLVMGIAMACLVIAALAAAADGAWRLPAFGALTLLAGLALERLAAGVSAARRFRDLTPLVFPFLHLGRDLAWVAAIAAWSARRFVGRPSLPCHSMRARARSTPRHVRPADFPEAAPARPVRPTRVLCLIPAHNEATNLTSVVAEVRACRPEIDILVVDDGSTDDTPSVLDRLEVRWLRFPERLGIGSAMRAGLRYAARLGCDIVVRMDGDGQHRADDIDRLLAPIERGRADVVLSWPTPTADAGRHPRDLAEWRQQPVDVFGACWPSPSIRTTVS